MDLLKLLFDIFPHSPHSPAAKAGIGTGLYHYIREESGAPVRFHLRVDSHGGGLLVVGAASIARLHPGGVIIAKGLLDGDDEAIIAGRLQAAFGQVAPAQVADDIREVRSLIAALETPGDRYPVFNLADPAFSPNVEPLDRPLTADVPLAEPRRIEPILERLWDLGIPHVTLIAGEAPNREHLVRSVQKAEDLGLIAGVRAMGSLLVADALIGDLATAGVDHVDVLYLSADAKVHDALTAPGDHAHAVAALREVHEAEVCPVADVALVESTFECIDETLLSLAEQGVRNAAFFALAMAAGKSPAGAIPADRLVQAAQVVEEEAEEANVRYLWYPPVRFHLGRSLAGLVCRGPRCSGDTAVRVEPDGSVFPARGPRRAAGNLLTDRWERIERSEPMRNYRKRIEADTHCTDCPGLAICAADCPRDPAGWADGG